MTTMVNGDLVRFDCFTGFPLLQLTMIVIY